jgi:LPS O-antigen subunit length determinant protein (WzzB/FepE family)
MTNQNDNLNEDKKLFNSQTQCDNSDEIDLVDLWLMLARHKMLILLSIVVLTGAGIGAAFLMTEKYSFSTSIDVGRIFSEGSGGQDGNVDLIEPVDTIRAKLTEIYIPMVQGRYVAENQLDKAGVSVSVSIPKGSNFLLLLSRGPLDSQGIHKEVHEAIIAALQEDHRQLTDDFKKRLETTLAKEFLRLEELEDPRLFAVKERELSDRIDAGKRKLSTLSEKRGMISTSIKEIAKLKTILEDERKKIQETLEKNMTARIQAAKEANNPANAMTLMMMDNQIQQNQSRLQVLQERLEIGLAAEHRKLELDLNDNQRATESQKAEIEQLQLQKTKLDIDREKEINEQKQTIVQLEHNITLIKNSKALALAVRSVGPVGAKKTMVMALSAVLGGMVGLFLAFAAEFRQRVRAKRLSMSAS